MGELTNSPPSTKRICLNALDTSSFNTISVLNRWMKVSSKNDKAKRQLSLIELDVICSTVSELYQVILSIGANPTSRRIYCANLQKRTGTTSCNQLRYSGLLPIGNMNSKN